MPNIRKEQADLARADADIEAGEKRLADQMKLIRELEKKGRSTVEAEKVRQNYADILVTFRTHRQLILDALKRH